MNVRKNIDYKRRWKNALEVTFMKKRLVLILFPPTQQTPFSLLREKCPDELRNI